MKRHPSRNRRGVTLVELMIGMMLGLVVVLAAGSVYLSVERSFRAGAHKLLAQREATLLSTVISRRVRAASSCTLYDIDDPSSPADSGNAVAFFDPLGAPLGLLQWDPNLETLVDGSGSRMSSMHLHDLMFVRDAAQMRNLHYRFKVDDERGNLVDIESAATLRN